MKKILQISKYFYPYIGGIEQVALDILHSLKGEDVEQKVICFNADAAIGDYTCNGKETVTDEVDGVEVIRCGSIAKVASQSISVTYKKQLKKVMDEFQPDIVIFHYPNPFVASLLLKYRKRDFKLFVYWHLDITKQKSLKKLFHGQNLKLIDRADKIVGATPKHLNDSAYTEAFGEKKQLLPYMINHQDLLLTEEEKEKVSQLKAKYQNKIIGFAIGRHVPYKGLKYLIEASTYLDEQFHFIIAGSGELTEELKKQAEGDTKVEFVGKISDSERKQYLHACDIFCFPSITRNEAFGLALAEGMYCEKPAVTFTIEGSGVNYVSLNGVTGIECPNGDSKAYAEALQKLADDANLRAEYGKNGKRRVEENFLFERFKKNLLDLISEE